VILFPSLFPPFSLGFTFLFRTFFFNRFEEAIIHTITWRYSYGIAKVPPINVLQKFLAAGFCYVSPSHVRDREHRPLLYVKLGAFQQPQHLSLQEYQDIFLYSLERAKKQSLMNGIGTFSTVLDFQHFSWHSPNCPPMSFFHSLFDLLKHHYPYRVGKIYLVHTSGWFSLLWKMIRPVVPKKVLQRVKVLPNTQEIATVFATELGVENVEAGYHPQGAQVPVKILTAEALEDYVMDGYWNTERRE